MLKKEEMKQDKINKHWATRATYVGKLGVDVQAITIAIHVSKEESYLKPLPLNLQTHTKTCVDFIVKKSVRKKQIQWNYPHRVPTSNVNVFK